jgi:putative DNA-invertase from lambdoid prophage Rac
LARIAYYRVSTTDQSIESQRLALGDNFDREYSDVGVSGGVHAACRPGLAQLLSYVREGDTVFIYALDRLGRDAIDVQKTVRDLLARSVQLHIHGLGLIASGVGELIVAVLAQISQMERQRIIDRCTAGRTAAKASIQLTGKTHKGKSSMGRPKVANSNEVRSWRNENKATILQTSEHFNISTATISRYCR